MQTYQESQIAIGQPEESWIGSGESGLAAGPARRLGNLLPEQAAPFNTDFLIYLNRLARRMRSALSNSPKSFKDSLEPAIVRGVVGLLSGCPLHCSHSFLW
jgi:hypothetical protein